MWSDIRTRNRIMHQDWNPHTAIILSYICVKNGVKSSGFSNKLGHTSIKTNETCLGSFESDQKKEITKYLTSFKEN